MYRLINPVCIWLLTPSVLIKLTLCVGFLALCEVIELTLWMLINPVCPVCGGYSEVHVGRWDEFWINSFPSYIIIVHVCTHTTHIHTHMHRHTHTCASARTYTHTCTHAHTHERTHERTHACTHIHSHECIHVYIHTCTYAHTHIHMHIHMHMHARTLYTHIYTHHIHMSTQREADT